MSEHVVFHVGLFGETSLANVASKRPSPIVGVHMAPQITRSRKGLVAFGALVRLLGSVGQLVVVEVGAGRKLLAA